MRKIIAIKDQNVEFVSLSNVTIDNIPIVTTKETNLTNQTSHEVMSLIDNNVKALDFPNIERRSDGLHAFTIGENSVLTSDEIVSKKEKVTNMDGTEEFTMPNTGKFTIAGEEVLRGDHTNNRLKAIMSNVIYPVGSTYTQYPHQTLGYFSNTENPTHLFGGNWIKIFSTESVFFRTEGSLAKDRKSVV